LSNGKLAQGCLHPLISPVIILGNMRSYEPISEPISIVDSRRMPIPFRVVPVMVPVMSPELSPELNPFTLTTIGTSLGEPLRLDTKG